MLRVGSMRWVAVLCALVVASTTWGVALAPAARAAEPGDNYPAKWKAQPGGVVVDDWGYYATWCTSWVAWALHNRNKFQMPRAIGNANVWGTWAKNKGYAVDSTPKVGSVYWTSPGYGHVAWVSAVNGNKVTIQEYNGNNPYRYGTRTITASGSTKFIHFKDLGLVKSTAPSISGTAKVGSKLTANKGAWKSTSGSSPSASIGYKYAWLANDSVISGATSSTYTPGASMAGKKISVKVTVSASGYKGASATSGKTAAVAAGTISSTSAPAITGTPKVGTSLTVSKGSWSPSPDSYRYQWYGNGVAISGATGASLTLGAQQTGQKVTAGVTVVKSGYSNASKTSASTAAVTPGDLTNVEMPVVSGRATVGQTLTVTTGKWQPAPDGYHYQWYGNSVAISGATEASLTLGAQQVGQKITADVTAVRSGYSNASRTSAPTAVVAPGDLTNVEMPVVSGRATVGQTLTVTTGRWQPAPDAVTRQWFANGAPIVGATGTTLRLAPDLLNRSITLVETATKGGHSASSVTSRAVGPVRPGVLTMVTTPRLNGRARVGATLRVRPGVWTPSGPTMTFRWYAGKAAIPGARGATLRIRGAHVGKRISVVVQVGTRGYDTRSMRLKAAGKTKKAHRSRR